MKTTQKRVLKFIGFKILEVAIFIILIQLLADGYITLQEKQNDCYFVSYLFINQYSNECHPENSIQIFMLAMKMLGIILTWLVSIGFVLGFILAILYGIYWLLRKWIIWNWRLTK